MRPPSSGPVLPGAAIVGRESRSSRSGWRPGHTAGLSEKAMNFSLAGEAAVERDRSAPPQVRAPPDVAVGGKRADVGEKLSVADLPTLIHLRQLALAGMPHMRAPVGNQGPFQGRYPGSFPPRSRERRNGGEIARRQLSGKKVEKAADLGR